MVSREKVIERLLNRLEMLLNALEITLIIQIPVSYVIALVKAFELHVVISLAILYSLLSIIYFRLRKRYSKLFEEWGKDPPTVNIMNKKKQRFEFDEHDFIVIFSPIAAIFIMLITWLLQTIL